MSIETNWKDFALAIIKENMKDESFLKSEWYEFLRSFTDLKNINNLFPSVKRKRISPFIKDLNKTQVAEYLNNNGCLCVKKYSELVVNQEDFEKAKILIENFKESNIPKKPKFKFFRSNSFQTLTGFQRQDFLKIAEKLNIPIIYIDKSIVIDYKYKNQFMDYFLNYYKK